MFHLRTGTPGAGKTLSLLDDLRRIKDRPIYYHGIPDLNPSLGWIHIDDPRDYHNQIIDGSIFVLDESQKVFPVRPPKEPVPPALAFIETHRHRGIDIYFITQHPNLLDHHARRLVGCHVHLQRNFGMPFSIRYTGNRLFDYENYHQLKDCEKTTYKFPKEVFGLYKSAEIHTHKIRIPKKLIWIPLLVGLVGFCLFNLVRLFNSHSQQSPAQAVASTMATAAGSASTSLAPAPISHGAPPIDWTKALIPAIPGLPYTAPFYKDLAKPVVLPVVAGCVASEKKCSCFTQQATIIDMDDALCRLNVKRRQFNPFKSPESVQVASDGRSNKVFPANANGGGGYYQQRHPQSVQPSQPVQQSSFDQSAQYGQGDNYNPSAFAGLN